MQGARPAVGPDYQLDTTGSDRAPAQPDFDLSGYLSKTSTAAHERIQWQLEAKEAQIDSRTELYEDQVGRLWTEIDQRCDELEALESKMWRTDEREERVAEKLSHLYGELREVRQRFHRELRELEDERIALQQELDATEEDQDLMDVAQEWL